MGKICTPKCDFFSPKYNGKISDELYDVDEYGVKKMKDYKKICLYDDTIIKSWSRECPRK